MHPDRGDDKLDRILQPIVAELKIIKEAGNAPHSYLWKSRNNLRLFPVFSKEMGKDQYHPSAEPSAKNRLFTMYHAQYSKHERRRIVDELVNGKSSQRVLFVTVAFAIGIDCNDIHRIVYTGVRYTRLGGLAEMTLQLGLTFIILMTFQKPVKNIPEAMRSYVQSKECKRKIILNQFDHKVPDNQPQDLQATLSV